ncbi:MAG: VWA domain-containing protein [Bryobacteraceae bacterium]
MKCAVALVMTVLLAGQERRFQVQARLVQVPVTVTDSRGRTVDGLEAADFIILDNGRSQKGIVDVLNTGVAPIALIAAVQTSGISEPVLAKVRKIGSMIQPLITGEFGCGAVMSFAERVRWEQECTNNPDLLIAAFEGLQPGEHRIAHMLDAAAEAIDRLRRRPNARRILLLISETRDRGSETSLDAVVAAAQTADVSVYAATYSAFRTAFTAKQSETEPTRVPKGMPPGGKGPDTPPNLTKYPVPPPEQRVDILGGIGELARLGKTNTTQVLAGQTGGATFSFTRQKGLEDAIERLGAELHSQYVLSFRPDRPAPGYHRLEVRVNRPGRIRTRSRPGYWLAGEAP